jgi:hypothetical protein
MTTLSVDKLNVQSITAFDNIQQTVNVGVCAGPFFGILCVLGENLHAVGRRFGIDGSKDLSQILIHNQ